MHSYDWIPCIYYHEGECDCLTQGLAPDILVSSHDDSLRFLQIVLSNRGFSHDVITFNNISRKMENSCHVGLQWDGSFCGNLGKCKETLKMFLVDVESGEIPPLCKLRAKSNLSVSPVCFRWIPPYTVMYKGLKHYGTSFSIRMWTVLMKEVNI